MAGADEPLRWSVTPAAKRETSLSQMRSHAGFAVLLRRRTPRPEKQTVCELASSWTRDESSLVHVRKAGIIGGRAITRHTGASRYPSPAGCANKGRPGYRRGDASFVAGMKRRGWPEQARP